MKKTKDKQRDLQNNPSKEEIFEKLVGWIKIPSEEKLTSELIKKIWKFQQ